LAECITTSTRAGITSTETVCTSTVRRANALDDDVNLSPARAGLSFCADELPRKHEPTVTISGKRLSGRTGTMTMLSSPTEHGAGQSPVPHTQGRHQLHPISVAAFARVGAALYSPQALTNDGNINAAFLCVGS
jgi:hypothetical protein